MLRRSSLLPLCAALLWPILAHAGDSGAILASLPRSSPSTIGITIHRRVEEVQLVFTVERGHRLIKDVPREMLSVLEDGRSISSITTFQQNSDLPVRIGLLVDHSDSMQKGFAAEQTAAQAFLERLLRPGIDSVFLLDFANGMTISPASPQHIFTRVNSLEAGGQTSLYDAIYAAARHSLMNAQEAQPVRRVLILLSDGEDTYSRQTLADALEAAQRAEVAIYAVTAHSPHFEYQGDTILRELAEATGGRAFVLKSFDRANQVFAQIEDDLRTQYSLTFRPTLAGQCGFHNVRVVPRDRKLHVRAREGYYACER